MWTAVTYEGKLLIGVETVNVPYHHGRLREALVDAGVELARLEGPDAVVLRAAARAAGVTHNAAYRHFADRDDLLRAVSIRCMEELGGRMLAQLDALPSEDDAVTAAWSCLGTAGTAYVEFALAEPGWFRTAFGVPRTVESIREELVRDPYQVLVDALDGLVAAGAIAADRRPGAEYAAWSAVHGLSCLLIDGPLRDLPAGDRQVALDKVLTMAIEGL